MNNFFKNIKESRIIWVLVILFVFVIKIGDFTNALQSIYNFPRWVEARFQDRQLSDKELKEQSLDIGKQLIILVQKRQTNEPTIYFDAEDWDKSWDEPTKRKKRHEYTKRSIRYSQQTRDIYLINYAPKVTLIREEFLKRGLINKDVDMFYEHPTNYIGYRQLALGLAVLANRLFPSE